jgi:hypothetical protein
LKDLRWYIWIPAVAIVLSVPFTLVVFAQDDHVVGLLIYVIPVVLGATSLGPMLAMTHAMVSVRMRAVSSSVLFFMLNFIGLGLGPWFTGIISDVLSVSQGAEGLRYTLMLVTLVNLWCAGHYLFAARDLRGDVAGAPS